MYHTFHLSVVGHLGYFHVLTITNSASMNIGVHVSFQIIVLPGYMPRSGSAGPYGSSVLFCAYPWRTAWPIWGTLSGKRHEKEKKKTDENWEESSGLFLEGLIFYFTFWPFFSWSLQSSLFSFLVIFIPFLTKFRDLIDHIHCFYFLNPLQSRT